jgi:hypothetical protein
MGKQSFAQGLDSDLEILQDDLRKASELCRSLVRAAAPGANYSGENSNLKLPHCLRISPKESQPIASIFREVEDKIFANSTLYPSPLSSPTSRY